jgi:dipeptidyl aminopeptidase/acylaminoacyl peptidase
MNDDDVIRTALHAVAEAPGEPDADAAWARIHDRIEAARPRVARRRVGVALAALAAAGAAAAALVVVAGQDDGREAVELVPADTATTDVAPTTEAPSTTVLDATGTPLELPARPLAVVVDADGTQRLDLYDADTGEVVMRDLASSAHSISDVSFGADGTVYFTEEFGDSSTVRMVVWDASAGPTTPFDLEDQTSSPAMSPDGSTFAFVNQGVTTDGGRIGLVDTATGEVRYLDWAPDEDDFFLTNGTIDGLEWSPDGSQLIFTVSYEGSEVRILDAGMESLSEAHFTDLYGFDAHWSDSNVVTVLRECCYPDFLEPAELISQGDGGGDWIIGTNGEVVAFDVAEDGTFAVVRPDGRLDLVTPDGIIDEIRPENAVDHPADGAVRAIDVEHPVLDVGF